MPRSARRAWVLLGLLMPAAAWAEGEPLAARLRDGSRVVAERIDEWEREEANPKIANRHLFDANNHVRWIVDTTQPPAARPASYVEFVGGDRLPGTVIGSESGRRSPFHVREPHLVVEPAVPVDPPGETSVTAVRVATRNLRRIAWEASRPRGLKPGTVFHRDGRETSFRRLRWAERAVFVLTDDGLQQVNLGEIEEIHFPPADAWDAYHDRLARLLPSGEGFLVRSETTDGLVLTTSTERLRPGHRGDRNKRENWHHLVQPAWSLDPLWLRFDTVRDWRIWKPEEVPLSIVRPVEIRRESVFGDAWQPRVDRSVQDTPLRSGDQPAGWGFGVQAHTELVFPLPASAGTFRTQVGLDELVAAGGCVKAAVLTGPNGERKLNESPVLIGSKSVHDTGNLNVADAAAKGEPFTLRVEMAHEGRPRGADPFDVRDACDWLDPLLTLDREALQAEVAARGLETLPAFEDWTLTTGTPQAFAVSNRWNEFDPTDPRYATVAKLAEGFVALQRTLRFSENEQFLAITAWHVGDEAEVKTRVQVRLAGRVAGEFELPRATGWPTPEPILVPVGELAGRDVEVELVIFADGDPAKRAAVDWRGIAPVAAPPSPLVIFDEQRDFPRELQEGDARLETSFEDAHTGEASLVMSNGSRGSARLPGLEAVIRERPRLGEYRYVQFAWSKPDGDRTAITFAHEGRLNTDPDARPPLIDREGDVLRDRRLRNANRRGESFGYRYDAGNDEPVGGLAQRLGRDTQDWQVQIRDLYGDFGNFTLTGLMLHCPDGELAEFDRIALARRREDFDRVDERHAKTSPMPPDDPNVRDVARNRWEYGHLLADAMPGFSTEAVGEGLALLAEFRGKPNVLRTRPVDNDTPCTLRCPVAVPEGGKATWQATVGVAEEEPWRLVVRAGDETLLDQKVDEAFVKEDGWEDVTVDLSRFAGERIVLTVEHRAEGNQRRFGYWAGSRVVPE